MFVDMTLMSQPLEKGRERSSKRRFFLVLHAAIMQQLLDAMRPSLGGFVVGLVFYERSICMRVFCTL